MDSSTSSLREIFADAADISDPAARAEFLAKACEGNDHLRARVERLLYADGNAGNFLRRPDTTTAGLRVSEQPGDRIGRYRLIERVGEGGGGIVYLAEQEEPVRRRVALKILKLGMDTQSFVTRFEAERQALAMMDHPNIARVLDAGATDRGRPFFVMEFVSGQRLSDYCELRQLTLRQRLELFIPVCQAVQHAHQKGVIHRDLKPSNILVTEHEGTALPKVIDFGIAKATGQGMAELGGLTSMNHLLGTPAYMSPEQLEMGRQDIDTRSDIYSLGVILYELLTGQPPFELTGADLETMRRLVREVDPPRPSTRITNILDRGKELAVRQPSREEFAAIRGDLNWIVMKCLEKDRRRRYDTANGVATDIRRHLENEPVSARPPSRFYRLQKIVRRHRLVFAAVGAVALILVAAVVVASQLALRATRAEQAQNRLRGVAEAEAAQSRQLLIRRYVAEGNGLAEENRVALGLPWMVAALQLEAGDPRREADERLRIAQTLEGAPELRLNLSQGKSVNCVALSSDGRFIATGSDDGIVRISDVDSGGEIGTNLALPGDVGAVCFSPDDTRLAAADVRGRVRVWNARSGEPLTPMLQASDFDESSVADARPWLNSAVSFSADGKLLLMAYGSKSAQLRDAATGRIVREFTHQDVVYHATFSADGKYVVTSSKDGTARVWDVVSGNPAAPPMEHTGRVVWAQFSSDGKKVLTMRDRHYVQLWDWRNAQRLAREIPRRSELYHASLSADGTTILTTSWSGYAHLYDASTGRMMRQFQQQGGLVDAAFSPDGLYVATACEDGNAWLWNADDATDHPLALPQGNHIQELAFSADGRRLAIAGRGGRARVWDLFPPPHEARRVPGASVDWVDFDHAGRRMLVLSSGPPGLGIFESSTGKQLGSVPLKSKEVRRTRFSPNDRRILAFGRGPEVLILDSDSGGEVIPPLSYEGRLEDASWSPDGNRILIAGEKGVQICAAENGKLILSVATSDGIRAAQISPDATKLATGNEEGTVQFWELPSGERLGAPLVIGPTIHQIEFSPDGKDLAIASDAPGGEGKVEIIDVASRKGIGQPMIHRDSLNFFQFSHDGSLLATACNDHTARVWNPATGEPVSPSLPQDFEGREVAFSPDGNRLATLARRGAVRLWNPRTGEPLSPPIEYSRNEGSGWVSYSPDGQRLLIARGGNEAWLRELRPNAASLQELTLLAEVLSSTRFDPSAGMVPMDEASLDRAWKELCASRAKH
jgi:WD40 repeat protein